MYDLKRIKRDCFWDYNFTEEEIEKLAKSNNFREKQFLFEKILLNSTRLFEDLKIFDRKDLKRLIESYKVPPFNYEYAFRRKNLVEVYFFDKPLLIGELKWLV
ncbi:hypothetical protein M1N70_00350 [Peptococcaceae bacterium]|nr:hypothetical protein [Peptococcaceae bacterium]